MMNHIVRNEGEFTAGADPELACVQKGRYVAVQNCGIVGTKKEPQPLPLGSNVQRDNVAIEFGVKPAKSCGQFIANIGDAISDMLDILPKGTTLDATASAYFNPKQLRHEECKQFYCDPDWNAWTMTLNDAGGAAPKTRLRSFGGHFHTGYVYGSGNDFLKEHEGKGMFIRVCDAIVGLPATVLDSNSQAVRRKKLYGKAGSFRPTEYGAEYRTLSNFWIKSPLLVELIYNLVNDALTIMREFAGGELIDMIGADRIQRVVTMGKDDEARELVDNYISRFMSPKSKDVYDLCVPRINNFDFMKEWEGISCI